jgi:hypothetical protein
MFEVLDFVILSEAHAPLYLLATPKGVLQLCFRTFAEEDRVD